MPGAGKTTLARALGLRLGLPVIEKDALKESLYDTLGVGDVAWSQRLGTATYQLIGEVARALLAAGRPLIAEANFFRGMEPLFATLPPHRLVQVHCHAPFDQILARYERRVGTRHPGHLDGDRVAELRSRFESGLNGPLELEGTLLELDTATAGIDALVEKVTAALTDS